jgi:hypothetical protein
MSTDTSIHAAVQRFAASVAAKMTQLTVGEPDRRGETAKSRSSS